MPDTSRKPYVKWLLWLLGIGATVFLLVLAVSFWLPRYFKRELDSALKEAVVSASDSLYRISYDDIAINIPLGNAEVHGVRLVPDSAVYQRRLARKNAPDDLFELRADQVGLSGVSLYKLLLFKSLVVGSISIDQPVARIDHDPKPYNNKKTTKSPYELINKVLKSIRIGKINLNNVNFTYLNHLNKADQPQRSQLDSLYLDVTDFLLDAESERDTSRLLFSENISLRAKGLELPSGNRLYVFNMAELRFSSRDSTIQVERVHYKPLFSKDQFSKETGHATERLDLEFKNIKASQVDVRRLLTQRQFFAKRLDIDAGLIDVDKDRRYPVSTVGKTFKYPHQVLLDAKTKIGFETVYLKSTRVLYGEVNPDTRQRGTIYFDGTHGTITNLTNDSAWIARNRACRVRVKTRFMSTGRLNAYFTFNLASRVGDFACGGTMGNFAMKEVNGMTKALALASVESGEVTKLDFNITANTTQSDIKMQLQYNGLEVNILKMNDETGKIKKRNFLSQVLNNVVMNENNPKPNRPARVAEATVVRAEDESFFNLIWHTIFVGIKKITIGIGK